MFLRNQANPISTTNMAWFLLSFLVIGLIPAAFAAGSGSNAPILMPVPNPNPVHSTIQLYCQDGICHTTPVAKTPVKGKATISARQIIPTQNKYIGIQQSQVCKNLITSKSESSCLGYLDLVPFDNTNPLWAGRWTMDDNYYHRLAPKIKNHYEFNNNTFVVMVDPNPDFANRARLITVTNENFTYVDQKDGSVGGINMTSHINRFVDPSCRSATVAPIAWLVNDTVHYLESNCTKTLFNGNVTTTQKEIAWSYDNPYSSLHLKAMTDSIKHSGGLGDCRYVKCPTDPYKKVGW